MPVAGYSRYIYINGRRYDQRCTDCSFTWNKDVGCESASLFFPTASFDDFLDIAYGDKVDIRFGTAKSTRWWGGRVSELSSQLGRGLSVSCNGYYMLLDEARPTGRFGTLVTTATPTGLATVGSTTGGTIPAGTYDYKITTVDELGETAASAASQVVLTGSTSSVVITWAAAQGAKGYRLYRKKTTDSTWDYWTVSELTFTDTNGTTGTNIAAPPSATTATEATIVSTKVEAIVDYLLDTFLPDDMTKGTVDAGAAVDVDDYDLTNSSGTLREVLQTLAKIAGDVMVYVDEDAAVHFIERGNPDTDTVPTKHRFTVGASGGDLIGSVVNASRTQSIDGSADHVVEGEDELTDADQSEGDLEDDDIGAIDDGTVTLNSSYYIKAKRFYFMYSHKSATTHYGGPKFIPLLSPTTKYFFLQGDATTRHPITGDFKKLLQTFPCLWKLYRMYQYPTRVDDNFTIAVLDYINRMLAKMQGLRYDSAVDYDDTATDVRQATAEPTRTYMLYAPGVKTLSMATKIAAREAIEKPPLLDKWAIDIVNLTQIVIPGVDIIQFTSRRGATYKLRVSSASYKFDDDPSVSLSCGDDSVNPKHENERIKKQVARLSERSASKGIWRPANSTLLIP